MNNRVDEPTILDAIKETEHRDFGDSEFSQAQHKAVDTLVLCATELIKLRQHIARLEQGLKGHQCLDQGCLDQGCPAHYAG